MFNFFKRKSPKKVGESVVVIGLGRFGGSVAQSLSRLGHEILGIDRDLACVQRWSNEFDHVVQADATDAQVLRELGVANFDHAVVGIGTGVEASILTVMALEELKIPSIWAKAINAKHGRILERNGAHHVVYPEHDMGERVAHIVTGKMIDFIEFDDEYAIAKTKAPKDTWGHTLAECALRTKFGVTVVGVKARHTDFTHAKPDTKVEKDDLLIVSGPTDLVEKFASQT